MTIDEICIPQASTSEFNLACKRTGEVFPLDKEVLIGRELDCTVRLLDAQIRRYHAKISVSDDGIFLEDLNAKNNTYLNGSRIGAGAWITLGDEINLDGVRFCIEPAKSTDNTQENTTHAKPQVASIPIYKAPEMPFSNQDVVEATRAMEERAKARLQSFKEAEESGDVPQWEEFIAKRFKDKPNDASPTVLTETPKNDKPYAVPLKPVAPSNASSKSNIPAKKSHADLAKSISALTAANDAITDELEHLFADDDLLNNVQAQQPEPELKAKATSKVQIADGSGPRLIVKTAPLRGKIYQLAPTDAKKTWTIGRASNADIQLTEDGVDLIHAHIEILEDQSYKIRTTRATNGMLINGMFKNEAKLSQGDAIQFGRMEFQYANDIRLITENPDKSGAKNNLNYGLIAASLVILGALLAALIRTPSL